MTHATRSACLLGATAVFAILVCLAVAPAAAAQDASAAADEPAAATDETADACADVPLWQKATCRVGENVQAGVSNIVTAGVTSVFDQLYEWVAGGASWLLGQLVSLMDSSTRPHVTA